MNISVVILTLNEEINIARCLESVKNSDDIVLVDSGSTDLTIDIAKKYGARIFHRKLDNWATHQNWINENIDFKNKWVYYSDADEVVTDELWAELLGVSNSDCEEVAFRVRYKNYFMGKWLKYSGGYPIWVLRFFIPSKIVWERLVNPRPIVSGMEGKLKGHFLHFSFNKGMHAWFDKHNKYSSAEAEEGIVSANEKLNIFGLFSLDAAVRRKNLKEFSFHLPCRSVLRFFYQYFLCLGFLDGYAGVQWCILNSIYEYMIDIKIKEMRRRKNNLPV